MIKEKSLELRTLSLIIGKSGECGIWARKVDFPLLGFHSTNFPCYTRHLSSVVSLQTLVVDFSIEVRNCIGDAKIHFVLIINMRDEDSAENNAAHVSDQPVPTGGVVGVVAEPPASTTTSSCTRLKWNPITVLHEDGTLLHPFITKQENWMAIMLLRRALTVKQPFDAPYGKLGAACWKEYAFTLSAAQDPHGNLVNGPLRVGDKAIKKRFNEYVAYCGMVYCTLQMTQLW
jgi:hypothetical protein